jgi:hypothetical protein
MSLFALALGLALAAGAEPFDVTWDAPSGCGSAEAVSTRAAEVLGDAMDRGERFDRVVAHGRVEAIADAAWRLELSYRAAGIEDVRTFEAPDCDGLVEGAALVLAVAATPIPAPAIPPEEKAPPPASTRKPPGVALRAEASVVSGLLGPAWPAVGGSIALRHRALRVELGGVHVFARRYVLRDPGFGAGAAIAFSAFTLRGCGVPTAARGRVEFPICVGTALGGATANAFGDLETPRTRWQPWIAVLAGPGVAVPIGRRLAVSLSIDAAISLLRPGFRVDGLSPELFRTGLLSARAMLGIEVRLP